MQPFALAIPHWPRGRPVRRACRCGVVFMVHALAPVRGSARGHPTCRYQQEQLVCNWDGSGSLKYVKLFHKMGPRNAHLQPKNF